MTKPQSSESNKTVSLPTDDALQLLLSPDGYYKYLAITKPPLVGGSLKYQAVMKSGGENAEVTGGGEVDVDQIKKNYRRLSLKHHPDKPGGDAEIFRVLTRAKVVLSNSKLRREYDLVGLDLEDEPEDETHQDQVDGSATENEEAEEGKGKTETVMNHIASASLAVVLQVVVKTGTMGFVSTIVSRYVLLTYLAIGGLLFISTRIYRTVKQGLGPDAKVTLATMKDALSPILISVGVYIMYRGRRLNGNDDAEKYLDWTWTFLFGETFVMTLFISNSFERQRSLFLVVAFVVAALFLSLIMKGKFWRYVTLLCFEGILALLVVLAFPIMEMILESIIEEKMKVIGEKIRAHDARMRALVDKGRI